MYNVQQISYMGTYSIPEVCQMINRSERTVRQMIANGLTTIDDKRPTLIRGTNLIDFLLNENDKNRCPIEFHQFYCLHCRQARVPKGKVIWFSREHPTLPNMCGICPVCGCKMHKVYKIADISRLKREFRLTESPCIPHSLDSSLNCRVDDGDNGATSCNQEFMKFEEKGDTNANKN